MADNEVLVVASKVKAYIKEKGDMKTSASVLEALSNKIRSMCDGAIESARNDGRKTVLDRDFS
jgi:histone H3/H4